MNSRTKRIGIVAADFHKELVDAMIEIALNDLSDAGAELVRVVHVPGAYEVPLVADMLIAQPGIDAVVVLGFIERGETLHGEVMGHVVHSALIQLQLKYHKPIGMGIIGPGATLEQAQVRKTTAARSAVHAALHGCELYY